MRSCLLFLAACGGASPTGFGPITQDGQDAMRVWCGETFEITPPTGLQAPDARGHPDAAVLRCSAPLRNGSVVFDTKTNELLDALLDSDVAGFDDLVNRLLLPTLNEDRKKAFAKLRPVVYGPHADALIGNWHDDDAVFALWGTADPKSIRISFGHPLK